MTLLRSDPTQSNPAGGPGNDRDSDRTLHRVIVVSLAMISLLIAWIYMATISRTDPWYRNTDMNAHNMVDALGINYNTSPNRIDQPGLPMKFLLALDYRIQHYLGLLPVWNLKKFGDSADPLREIPPLIRVGRDCSRVLIIVCILFASWLTYSVMRTIESACLTIILLCGSSGLLFHGLLVRPELLCVGFGNVLALLCAWRATTAQHWFKSLAWLFFAGLFGGLSALTKLPGMCYLALCYGWCWLAALTAQSSPGAASVPARGKASFWGGLFPAISAMSALWLIIHVGKFNDPIDPVAILRLRLAAVFVGLLPLLSLWTARHRLPAFLLDRSRELAVLSGGALATLPLSYLLLRTVMTEPSAAQYLAGILRVLLDPGPFMKDLLAVNPDIEREFMIFFREAPALYLSGTAVAVTVCLMRSVPLRLKAFILLLTATALGMTLLLCRRYFAAQYSIFPQVPILLVWSLSLSGLYGVWREKQPQAKDGHWSFPITVTVAFVLMLTVYFRLEPKYTHFQSDADLPVRDFTVTFLFDHDAHTDAYLQIMKAHYGNREDFTKILEHYLADPANRY